MGIFTATARNLFVCPVVVLFLVSLTVPSRPVLAQSQKPVAQSQKLAVSYDEKKRQANDIAVAVVVSGISCTCARFTEDIRNVVNDLGPRLALPRAQRKTCVARGGQCRAKASQKPVQPYGEKLSAYSPAPLQSPAFGLVLAGTGGGDRRATVAKRDPHLRIVL